MTDGVAIPPPVPGRPGAPRRRCVRHEDREASGRCTECGGAFCRECVTEHEDRLYCAPCFAARLAGPARAVRPKRDWRRWRAAGATAGSVLCLIAGFYALGRVLAAVPPELHDGTIWKDTFGR